MTLAGESCNARLTSGEGTCKNRAGAGTSHLGWGRCKYHGGSTSAHTKAAAREEMQQRFLGDEVNIEPTEAILAEIRRSAGHVNWLHGMILKFDAELENADPSRVLLVVSEQGWVKAAWIKLYQEERTHLVKTCKMALDAGVAERQVKLAENQGELIAQVLRQVLNKLGLTDEQQAAAPEIVREALRLVS